jgi:hypothetical protein
MDLKAKHPIALTIAGSDPGGGAGIQADLKTFHQFGAFGTSAIVALTAQNTTGVSGVHPVPLDFVRAQDVMSDVPIIVVTTRGDDSSRGRALAAGATRFMTKPFEPADILAGRRSPPPAAARPSA